MKTYKIRLDKEKIKNLAQLIAVGNWFVNSVRVPRLNERSFQEATDDFMEFYNKVFPEAKSETGQINKDTEEYLLDKMTYYIDFYNAEIRKREVTQCEKT